MLIDILLLAIGLVILILGANWLVDGASSIAAKLGVSAFTIGLTVVAFGTSLPELVVNIMASVEGSSGLAIGNVVGSNTINILLVIGIAALVKPVNIHGTTVKIEIPFSLLAALALFVLANDVLIDGAQVSVLSRTDGILLMMFLGIFLYYTLLSAKKDEHAPVSKIIRRKNYISILMVTVGVAGLYFGGELIVNSAISIAQMAGISESLIGLTVLALGTSLPELVTSVVAAFKGNSDLAIGNVLGSNIFNIFMVLGVSSTIMPLTFYPESNIDIMVTCLASVLLFSFALLGPGQKIDRKEGALFVSIYIAYIVYLVVSV
ncbi:MAG: calcium/sodium antiporter [Bacteroidales bacterium]